MVSDRRKPTILFLAANPRGTNWLKPDQEARAIRVELERSDFRDSFEFIPSWATEPLDLLRQLRAINPTVLHFSGRGGIRDGIPGLLFQGPDGQAQVVSARALGKSSAQPAIRSS